MVLIRASHLSDVTLKAMPPRIRVDTSESTFRRERTHMKLPVTAKATSAVRAKVPMAATGPRITSTSRPYSRSLPFGSRMESFRSTRSSGMTITQTADTVLLSWSRLPAVVPRPRERS